MLNLKKLTSVAFAVASATSFLFGANVVDLVKDDFEKGEKSPSFSNQFFTKKNVKLVSGKEAIKGNYSIYIDGNGQRKNIVLVPKVQAGDVYLFEVAYKIKKLPPNSKVALSFSVADKIGRSAPTTNYHQSLPILNKTLHIKEGYRVPKGDGVYHFRMTVSKDAEIYIDNIRITRIVPDEVNSYLFCENHDKFDILFDKVFPGMYYSPTAYSFLSPDSPILDMPKEKFFPFIDKWGQYKYSDWPNKIKSDDDLKNAHAKEQEVYKKFGAIKNRDKYGALENSCGNFKPTGRFCLDKVDGKWTLRAPNGNIFWAFGLNSVGLPTSSTIIDGREHFFDDLVDTDGIFIRRVSRPMLHYPKDWRMNVFNLRLRTYMWKHNLKTIKEALDKSKEICDWRMKNWGISAYGAWSGLHIHRKPVHPYILLTDAPKLSCAANKVYIDADKSLRKLFRMVPDVYDPRFRTFVANGLKKMKKELNHELCVGVFVDNEVTWERKEGYTTEAILTCPKTQKAKIAFRDMLKAKYNDIAKLNESWNSKYTDWNNVLTERKFIPTTESAKKDIHSFDEKFHERYYKICREEVKKASPDVLYFGSRFAWRNKYAVKSAEKHCDVVSFNRYALDVRGFDEVKTKPIIIGEFSFSRSDYGHFWKGPRQAVNGEDQITFLNNFMESALTHPNVVGACWFTYGDQDTAGRPDGENAAFGVVDVCDTPHYDLIEAFRNISQNMFDVRFGKKSN
jgi:hypothetical protein